jgi:hypothetical protein
MHSLTSALGGEWSASYPGRFTSKERARGTHWIRDWMGPRTVLDAMVKRKIPSPRRETNPRTPIVQPVDQRQISKIIVMHISVFKFLIHVTGKTMDSEANGSKHSAHLICL